MGTEREECVLDLPSRNEFDIEQDQESEFASNWKKTPINSSPLFFLESLAHTKHNEDKKNS